MFLNHDLFAIDDSIVSSFFRLKKYLDTHLDFKSIVTYKVGKGIISFSYQVV